MNTHLEKTELDDLAIIERVLDGEVELYEKIVRKYNPYLYKVGRSYNYNHEDTQDLMQDTFVHAYKNLSSFKKEAQFKTWLVRIMLNNCYHKKQKFSFKNEVPSEIYDGSTPFYHSENNNTLKEVHNHQLKDIIENALSRIPEDYRMVFSLREVNGFSTQETADLLGITISNVKVRLNRAKEKLQSIIQESYKTEELYDFNLIYCDGITNRVMTEIRKFEEEKHAK